MENLYCSGWPEGANSQVVTTNEPSFVVPWHLTAPQVTTTSAANFQFYSNNEFPSLSIPFEDKATSASKSHSLAEKRRRDRINAQLSILRKLIPKSDKMDKAALLGRAIDEVKELNQKAEEVRKASLMVPTEIDELTIESDISLSHHDTNNLVKTSKSRENAYIRASICCEDCPELFSELVKVLQGLRLTTVRADVASVGGRTKCVLLLCPKDSKKVVCLNTLKDSLKSLLGRIASSSMDSNYRIRSKRERFFLPCK